MDAILKLYDRRCMSNVRQKFDDDLPLNGDKQLRYINYRDSLTSDHAAPDFDSPQFLYDNEEVDDGMFEAYLEHCCMKFFTAEAATYSRLGELQGKLIPKFFSTVEVEIPPLIATDGKTVPLDPVNGVLLEYIPSISIRDFVTSWPSRNPPLPTSILISVCKEAVACVDRMSDFDILNEDARLDNILVRQPFIPPSSHIMATGLSYDDVVPFPCVVVDLAQCRSRRDDESDEEWASAKWSHEAGAVGFVVAGVIQREVGKGLWKYQRSMRFHTQ